jgi:hypothetical protein
MKFYKLIKALIFCLGLVFVISCEDDFYKEAPNFQNIITLKGDKNTFKKLVSKSQQKSQNLLHYIIKSMIFILTLLQFKK